MNARDVEKARALIARLVEEFKDPAQQSTRIFRGDVRAIKAMAKDYGFLPAADRSQEKPAPTKR